MTDQTEAADQAAPDASANVPAPEPPFKIGDIVAINGQEDVRMTVEGVFSLPNDDTAFIVACVWFDGYIMQRGQFPSPMMLAY